jgi:hypothetical protein
MMISALADVAMLPKDAASIAAARIFLIMAIS